MVRDIYRLEEQNEYTSISNLIVKDIKKLRKGKQIIDIHKTHFWTTTGGSSLGLYQEHHSSSTTIRLVAGKKKNLEKYIILLYLTNLDERCYTGVIERCHQSFNGRRCHKYINIICNYEKVEPCSSRDNHFYEHLGEFNSTLSPWLETKESTSVYVEPIHIFKDPNKIININKIKNFSKIDTQAVTKLAKKFGPKINSLLKIVNNITDRINDCEADDNCDFITNPKKLKALDKVFRELYYQRAKKLTEFNSVSSIFL